eukprot:362716-Chlamydomonas_euryale.AAC.7
MAPAASAGSAVARRDADEEQGSAIHYPPARTCAVSSCDDETWSEPEATRMLSGAAARLCGAAAAHKLPGVNRESVAQLATDVAQTALGPLAGSTSRQAVSSSAALRSAGDRHAYFNVPMLLGLFASLSKPTLEQREEVAAKGLRCAVRHAL